MGQLQPVGGNNLGGQPYLGLPGWQLLKVPSPPPITPSACVKLGDAEWFGPKGREEICLRSGQDRSSWDHTWEMLVHKRSATTARRPVHPQLPRCLEDWWRGAWLQIPPALVLQGLSSGDRKAQA